MAELVPSCTQHPLCVGTGAGAGLRAAGNSAEEPAETTDRIVGPGTPFLRGTHTAVS